MDRMESSNSSNFHLQHALTHGTYYSASRNTEQPTSSSQPEDIFLNFPTLAPPWLMENSGVSALTINDIAANSYATQQNASITSLQSTALLQSGPSNILPNCPLPTSQIPSLNILQNSSITFTPVVPANAPQIVSLSTPQNSALQQASQNADAVREKLIITGQMERLNNLAERRLSEVGWRSEVTAECRNIIKRYGSNITHQILKAELSEFAKAKVPEEVKADILEKIKYCYESDIPTD